MQPLGLSKFISTRISFISQVVFQFAGQVQIHSLARFNIYSFMKFAVFYSPTLPRLPTLRHLPTVRPSDQPTSPPRNLLIETMRGNQIPISSVSSGMGRPDPFGLPAPLRLCRHSHPYDSIHVHRFWTWRRPLRLQCPVPQVRTDS